MQHPGHVGGSWHPPGAVLVPAGTGMLPPQGHYTSHVAPPDDYVVTLGALMPT
jgi:hypothetical protein